MNPIWKKECSLESANEMCKNTAIDHLGIEFIEIGPDFIKASMPVDHRTFQPARLLHGGAMVLLAESLGGIASSLCLNTDLEIPVGIEINANHLKSSKSGIVIGTVRPIHLGSRLHVWEIRVENEKQQLCSIARLTNQIVSKT
jgi:1,4-dihydroxy-2-naphthoyl-CoA hydrolase